MAAPTMQDARRAALAVAGAMPGAEVMVFGSVARGEAGDHSDIDLLVLVADLDYSERLALSCGLREIARGGSSTEVDVVLRDMPEWAHRKTKVRTSLECQAAADAVVVVPGQFGRDEIDWDKEIGMPLDSLGEALAGLNNVTQAVCDVSARLLPDRYERAAVAAGDHFEAQYLSRLRRFAVCGSAHMACEAALKTLHHLIGEVSPPNVHNLQLLCDRLTVPAVRRQIDAALDAVRIEPRNTTRRDLHVTRDQCLSPRPSRTSRNTTRRAMHVTQGLIDWRQRAHYGIGPWEHDHRVTDDYVRVHCEIALGLAHEVASCVISRDSSDRIPHSREDPRSAARLQQIVLDVGHTLASADPTAGQAGGAAFKGWFTPFAHHLPPA